MKKRDFIALIWENLMRRKARVALTAVGVVVGTASILILVSLIGALKQNAAESLFGISEMRKITVMPGYGESSDEEDNFFGGMYVDAEESGQRTPTAPLNQSAVAYLTALPGVESVVLMDGLTGYGTLTFAKTEAYATILGVKTDDLGKLGVEAAEGSLELSPGTIILGASIPESFSQEDQRPGAKQSSQPDLLGKWVSIVLTKYDENGGENRKVLRLRVGGILQEGNGESDWSAYISMKDADTLNQWYTGKRANRNRNGYQQAIVLVRDPKNTLEITQQIKERGYKTFTAQSFLKGINGFFLVLQLIFGGIGAISLFVAAIGISNTMAMAILERTREIGLMKAIGATNQDVLTIFLGEAGGIGFLGGVGGALLGAMVNFVIGVAVQMALSKGEGGLSVAVKTSPGAVLFIIVFSTIVGILSGIYPALRAATLVPVEALRTE
jgi:putative ABC transport system permease protein